MYKIERFEGNYKELESYLNTLNNFKVINIVRISFDCYELILKE